MKINVAIIFLFRYYYHINNKTGEIIDPTSQQFGKTPIPYEKGTGAGFLTKEPSKPAKTILERLGTEKVIKTPSGVVLDFANQKGIKLNTIQGGWDTNLIVRPEKDWEKDKGRAVSEK